MAHKIALFAFNGDPMCFVHVLLNALDFHERGFTVRVVVEGAATALVPHMAEPAHVLHPLAEKVKASGLVDGVCKACATKTGTVEAARAQGFALLGDAMGHPGMGRYRADDFEIITF